MPDIQNLLYTIIPPNNYGHRNGFNNKPIIDKLSEIEKKLIIKALIEELKKHADMLIVETLTYMKATEALDELYLNLKACKNEMDVIIISSSIFELNSDQDMVNIAAKAFALLNDTYQLIPAFYYLKKFRDKKTDKLISGYFNNPDYLLSYNAKRALNY